jgi:hypothetical protein
MFNYVKLLYFFLKKRENRIDHFTNLRHNLKSYDDMMCHQIETYYFYKNNVKMENLYTKSFQIAIDKTLYSLSNFIDKLNIIDNIS